MRAIIKWLMHVHHWSPVDMEAMVVACRCGRQRPS